MTIPENTITVIITTTNWSMPDGTGNQMFQYSVNFIKKDGYPPEQILCSYEEMKKIKLQLDCDEQRHDCQNCQNYNEKVSIFFPKINF